MNTQTTAATVTGIDLCGFLVEDPAKAIAFYRDVIGMTPTAVDPEGRGAEFTLSDGTTFGVWREPSAKPGAFFMIAVDDIKAAIEDYRRKGLTVSDADETPVCFMAFTQDNEGNGLIIHQRKS